MEVSNNWNRLQTGEGIAQLTNNLKRKQESLQYIINYLLIALEVLTEGLSLQGLVIDVMVRIKKTEGRLDCPQLSIFSYFYSIVEREGMIARELDTSAKRT